MSDTSSTEPSNLNDFWDAISEIVQNNNDYMTPSPDSEKQDDFIEETKFTYDFFPNQLAEEYQANYFYMYPPEKLETQSYMDQIFNVPQQVLEPTNELLQINHTQLESEANEINFPMEIKTEPFASSEASNETSLLSDSEQVSLIKALLQRSLPIHDDNSPATPSSTSEFQDEDEENEDDERDINNELNLEDLVNNAACVTDDELIQLSVRDLNRRLKNLPRDERNKLKQRRRLLKNRGYAQTCRSRRINSQKTLIQENQQLKELLHQTNAERNLYKTKYENLKALIKKAKLERERKKSQSN